MCRRSTLTTGGRLFADVRNDTGTIRLGEESQLEDSQPDSWKKGQTLMSLCQFGDFDEAEGLFRYTRVPENKKE
jgi:hypothetical protein